MTTNSGDDDFDARTLARTLAERPAEWESARAATKRKFNEYAPDWDDHVGPHHVELLDAALAGLPAPRVALDLGTGTGVGAGALARHFDDALILGADLAEQMIHVAATKTYQAPVRFLVADGSRLPFPDGSLDLVIAMNVFVFFSEVARVLGPDGRLGILYSRAEETPIYLPSDDLHRHLRSAGFASITEGRAALGIYHLAHR